jgi:hypothetical protein
MGDPQGGAVTILGRARVAPPAAEADESQFYDDEAEFDDPEPPAAGTDRPATPVRPAARWPLVACVVLALTALVFAILALQQRGAVQASQEQASALRDVSGQAVAALTSYDYQHLDQWKASVLRNATGSFENQFQSSFASFEQAYVAEHNRGTGAVQDVWVGPVASGKASTVVLVDITVTSLTGTHSLEPYVQVTLLKVAGRWRVDDVQATFDTGGGSAPSSSP